MKGFEFGTTALRYPPQPSGTGSPDHPVPIILFLHGIGERGGPGDLDRAATWGLPRLRASGWCLPDGSFPFEVIVPQCPMDKTWCDDDMQARLDDFLDSLLADRPVDRRKLYLTGFSMGGIGAFTLALRTPQRFAAVAPVCGRCVKSHGLHALRHMPFWIAYAQDDEIVELTEGSEEALRHLLPFGKTEKRAYKLGAHGDVSAHVRTCEYAYAEPALYEWFLENAI
ncbi:MAG: alpha/beta fold hydrolase [Hyphomicrobiales bacterium]|nr:alpha/beta fold hydrolase [Hyphomicrobiales bacterium]